MPFHIKREKFNFLNNGKCFEENKIQEQISQNYCKNTAQVIT
jgi:hypothetical protein